ncbi:MAG: hypothetical protein ABR507_10550 [Actinomycetota bacterium]|nr:hypothetical protein [Actinomycetota bacterium]
MQAVSNPLFIALFVGFVGLAVLATFRTMGRASKGYDKAKKRRAEAGPVIACSTCGSNMNFVGLQGLRLAETGVGDQLGADSTGNLPLEVFRCLTCRKVEFFLPPSAG